MVDEIKTTALVHVGPAHDDEAIYCEAVELKQVQYPRLWRNQQEAFNAQQRAFSQQEFFARQARGSQQSPYPSILSSLGNGFFGVFGGFF